MSQGEAQDKDPEIAARSKRRAFTAAYKRRMLQEVDACKHSGEISALLRREGLSPSHITAWRRQRLQDQSRPTGEMNHLELESAIGADGADAHDSRRVGSKWVWLILLAGTFALPMYACMWVVFLVLTGIIAEPETVIEHILRALLGG